MAKPERVVLEGKNLRMFLNESFLKKIESLGNILPISIFFIRKKVEGKKTNIAPLLFNHQTDKEIENNILHVESADLELLEKVVKKIENEDK